MAAKGMRHPRTGQHGQSMAPPGGAGV